MIEKVKDRHIPGQKGEREKLDICDLMPNTLFLFRLS